VEKDPEVTLFLPLSVIAVEQLSKLNVLLSVRIGDPEADDS
jgi:hypothetical protein